MVLIPIDRVVQINGEDIVEKIFQKGSKGTGIGQLYQSALEMTALDQRRIGPPVQGREMRKEKMKEICKKENIQWETVEVMQEMGIKSVEMMQIINRKT